MTVEELFRALQKLIEEGHATAKVCMDGGDHFGFFYVVSPGLVDTMGEINFDLVER